MEILTVILCLFSLLFGAPSAIEWVFLLIVSVADIPLSASILRKLKKERQGKEQGKKTGDGSQGTRGRFYCPPDDPTI